MIGILAALLLFGPFSISANFSADLFGPVDTRPNCWGHADFVTWPITFQVPAGYRVRILHARGDLLAWPKVLPGETPVPAGRYAGVLMGLQRSGESTAPCDWCEDTAMLYIQAGLSDAPARAAFNDDVSAGGLLGPDHKLIVKVAAWLNTTERPIHIEPTFNLTYQFESESGSPLPIRRGAASIGGGRMVQLPAR